MWDSSRDRNIVSSGGLEDMKPIRANIRPSSAGWGVWSCCVIATGKEWLHSLPVA